MKYFLLFLLVPQITLADVANDCGEYLARGVIRANKKSIDLIINEKSMSEYVITMPFYQQAELGGYLDKEVTMKIVLDKKFNGQKGELSKIISTERRIPNPLNPEDTGLKLIKKSSCKKE